MRTDLLKVDFSNYESPIQKLVMDVEKKMMQEEENQLFMSVKQAVGFSVDKEELLKALKYDRDQYEKGYIDGLKADRWIPVSDEFPEELKGVLVYCPKNDNIFCAYLENGVWKIFSPIALEEIKEIVTAWMPLPERYKGD